MKIDFFEFIYIWFKIQKLSVPKHQKLMTAWLFKLFKNEEKRQGLLMSFRNSGKSTIVGLFCAWVLYYHDHYRILVIAADYALAKKMVRNVKRIIEKHPLTTGLKPSKLDQWASDQFTVNRSVEQRDPSMLAKGLSANLTGLRADLIICDDVEVPNNCDSPFKRRELREKLSELDYILTPQGMQLYIGTPHSFYTIYQTAFDESKKEQEPFLLNFEQMLLPILNGKNQSAWPERFSLEKIASIRSRSGENKFLSQMMLKPVNTSDSVLDPNRLRLYNAELSISYSQNREVLKLGDKKLISASCWWDPSFGNKDGKTDNSVVACVFVDEEGGYWLHDIKYLHGGGGHNGNNASFQCEQVADFLSKNHLFSVHIETNGIGKFLPSILREVLKKRKIKAAVLESHSKENKEQRILDAFEVLLADRALNAHCQIWQSGFIEEMREWSPHGNGKDDALDAVAGCLLSEPIRFSKSSERTGFSAQSWQGGGRQFSAATKFEI